MNLRKELEKVSWRVKLIDGGKGDRLQQPGPQALPFLGKGFLDKGLRTDYTITHPLVS